jgi:CubicO group peptidase (beta-lactamase class C family)
MFQFKKTLFILLFLLVFSYVLIAQNLKTTSVRNYDDMKDGHIKMGLESIVKNSDYIFAYPQEYSNTTIVYRAGPVSELSVSENTEIGKVVVNITDKEPMSLDDYLPQSDTQGVIVLHKGRIIYERYNGILPRTSHAWFSAGKTTLGVIAHKMMLEGQLDLCKTVSEYVPVLGKSGWRTVPIRTLLNMTSGMDFYEDPTRIGGLFSKTVQLLLNIMSPNILQKLKDGKRVTESEEFFDYQTANSIVLTMVIESITDRPYSDVLSEYVWQKMGAENDAQMAIFGVSTGKGYPIGSAGGGMMSTLRDMARYGLLYTPSWSQVASEPVIDESYFDYVLDPKDKPSLAKLFEYWKVLPKGIAMNDPTANVGFGEGDVPQYGCYQWDMVFDDGDMYKEGMYGQGLYVSHNKDIVIGYFGYNGGQKLEYTNRNMRAFVRAITREIETLEDTAQTDVQIDSISNNDENIEPSLQDPVSIDPSLQDSDENTILPDIAE